MRGIIMEIKENKAVILCNDGSFKVIRNRNFTVGQEIDVPKPQYNTLTAIAACLLLFIGISSSWYSLYKTPSSYVYLDINPSIRLDINYFEKIISVVPLNDDATDLMSEYSFDKKKTEECINDIVIACREMKYINENNNDIEIEVVTAKSTLVENVNVVSDKLKNDNMVVSVSTVSKSDNKRAMDLNISIQKLKAVEAYTNTFGGSISDNAKELKKTSVKDIYTEINKHDFTDSIVANDTISDNAAAENTNVSISSDFQTKPKSDSKKPAQPENIKKADSNTSIAVTKTPKPWKADTQASSAASKGQSKKDRTDNTASNGEDKKHSVQTSDNDIYKNLDKDTDKKNDLSTFKPDTDNNKDEKINSTSNHSDKKSDTPSNNSNNGSSSDKKNDTPNTATNNIGNPEKKNEQSSNIGDNIHSDNTVDDNINKGDNKKTDTQPKEQPENKKNDNNNVKVNPMPSTPKEQSKPSDAPNSDKTSRPNRSPENPSKSDSGALLNSSSPSKSDAQERHGTPSAPEKSESMKNNASVNNDSAQNSKSSNVKPSNPSSSDNKDSNKPSTPNSPSRPADSSKKDSAPENKHTDRNTVDKASRDNRHGENTDNSPKK